MSDTAQQPGSKRLRVMTPFVLQLLIIMFVVEFVKGALLLTILPVHMRTALGASAFVIGWTLTVQYIGDNLLRTPFGWLIDRYGYRLCMLGGVLLSFAAIVLVSVTTHYGWIVLASAMLGMGTGPLWPCVIAGATGDVEEEARGTVMSVVYMAWLSGVGLGPVVINFFIGTTYVAAFRLLIGLMIAVVFVALFLPNRNTGGLPAQARSKNQAPLHERVRRFRRYFREVRNSLKVSRLLFPAMFAQNFALGLLTPVLTLYARTVLRLTPEQYSFFLMAGGAVTVLCLIPVGKLVDRFGVHRFLWPGFGIASLAMLLFTYFTAMPMLYVLVTALGIGYACIIPSWNALISYSIPEDKRGAVWGFFLTVEGLGTVTGPLVSGKLWDMFGAHAPFLLSGAVLLILMVLQSFLRSPRRSAGERQSAG